MDARPRQIADQALALAEAFLAASRDNIAALADGDGRLLYEAGEVLRLSPRRRQPGLHAAEHVAYALISEVRQRTRRARDTASSTIDLPSA